MSQLILKLTGRRLTEEYGIWHVKAFIIACRNASNSIALEIIMGVS